MLKIIQCFDILRKEIKRLTASIQILNKLKSNPKSRIFYVGAGTFKDRCPRWCRTFPTFGWPLNRVKFIIAGGQKV